MKNYTIIFVWMSNNKLAINANKTEVIQFSTRPEQQINVHIGQLDISASSCVRSLGVHLDEKLTSKIFASNATMLFIALGM